MPNPSIKNERVYRALRRKGYSKERAARISNAMKAAAVAPLVVAPTGPGGLFSTAGLEGVRARRRKLLARRKAFDEGKVKRDDTGKFSGDGGGASSPAERSAKRLAAAEAADKRRAGEAAALAGEKDPKRRAAMRQEFATRRADERAQARREREGERVAREEATEAKRADAAKKREGRLAAAAERKAKLEAKRAEREAAKLKKAEEKKKKGGGGGKKEPEKQTAGKLPPLLSNLYGLLSPSGKSFAVTKSADGRHRWILRTTTAYRDRDGEILSEAALDRDSQRMTSLKQFGPLRYWHMGAPDPADARAPWGPGVDLGMCDYSQVIGRTRVESGTFYDERVGAAFKAAASQYEASPGFFHTPDQPAAGGVFQHIQTFERSLVPVRLARASNLFTGMHATKEQAAMTPEEFRRRAKAFLDDMAALGVAPEAAQATLQAAQTAEKAAQQRGIAYKAAAEAPAVYELPDGTPAIIVEGRLVALKAATVKAPMPPAEMMQAGISEAVDGAVETLEEGADEAEGDDDGPILGPADLTAIAEAVVGLLMGKMGDMQQQLNAFEEELKARGYARMKEAADQLGPKLDRLTSVLGQYVDDLPAAGHRASQDAGTAVAADDPVAAQGALNVGAKSEAPPATPEAALIRWMEQHGGGALPWDVPGRTTLPEGVNPAQHTAPGTR